MKTKSIERIAIEPNINWGLRLEKGFLNNLKQCLANIRCANICKQIFAWKWNSLKVLLIFSSKQIFWRKFEKILKVHKRENFFGSDFEFLNSLLFLHSIFLNFVSKKIWLCHYPGRYNISAHTEYTLNWVRLILSVHRT
jgi:hypothetical protein